MEQLTLLILLCFSMLIGSYFSGTIPMAFPLSESRSKLLTITGSGILVGTALAIIIPEGVNSIYSERQACNSKASGQHVPPTRDDLNLANPSDYDPYLSDPVDSKGAVADDSSGTGHYSQPTSQTFVIGLSLVSGFVLMLLIDQFSASHKQHSSSQHQGDYQLASSQDSYDMMQMGSSSATSSVSHNKDKDCLHVPISSSHSVSNIIIQATPKVTPTLGLVIHASADGIALGAAATTSHREIEMIIFLAIMLHKAPAAFGLVAFLLHRGLKHATIRRHLLAFSVSAPLAAFITYFGLSQSGKEALQRHNATGIAMLFSAGTFLYVATVHVLPELVHNRRLSSKEIVCFIVGAFLPSLLAQAV